MKRLKVATSASSLCMPPTPTVGLPPYQLQSVNAPILATKCFWWKIMVVTGCHQSNSKFYLFMLIGSPNTLAPQWLDEACKFFPEEELKLIEWKAGEDLLHQSALTQDHIVWLVRDSCLGRFGDVASKLATNFQSIPCLATDESHIYLRNLQTRRGQGWQRLINLSFFVLHLSGTLFPLKPKKDGLLILRALGEKFKPQSEGRWTAKIALQLHQLQQEWNVLQFRHCITALLPSPRPFQQV